MKGVNQMNNNEKRGIKGGEMGIISSDKKVAKEEFKNW